MTKRTVLVGWLLSGAMFLGGSVFLYLTWGHHSHKHDDHKDHDHGKSGHKESGDKHDDHKGHKHDDHKGHDHGKSGHKDSDDKHDDHKGHDHEKGNKHEKHSKHESHGGEVRLSSAAMKRVKLQYATVREGKGASHQIGAVGRVSLPPQSVSRVGSRVEGRIVRWFVKLGQKVKRGQSLALLDSPAVGRSRATFLKCHALERLAQTEYRRAKRLKSSGLASSKQLLAAKVAHQKAVINLRIARAQLQILGVSEPSQKQLRRLSGLFVLRAPSSGEVTAIPASLGAWVNPQATIMRIESRNKIWALLEIYGRDFPYVRVGQRVHLYGPGIHKHLEGTIQYLSSHFERGAQTLEARVVLLNPKGKLRPNQFLYAKIQSDLRTKASKSEPKVLLIPEDAIQRIGRRQVVFVVGREPGHFDVRTVVTVEAPDGLARVLYGLSRGERLVSKGTFVLKSELMRSALEDAGHGHSH
ncbi:MAG: efflux RND transporter periplasmic adaptor subunit [Deltaproteobacteria bacterium]|nr:MAG: efflux RND transporter periplasmic adaptor subunit [Deltaproteobacteria bacterium]